MLLQKHMFSQKKTYFHKEKMFLGKIVFSQKNYFLKKACFHKNLGFHQKNKIKWVKKNQQRKQNVGQGFDLWSCFFFIFSVSSCFFQFLPIFPLFHPVNSSNLTRGVGH